ncbi:MAG: nuclear transport factor 2 family protein [Acidimicrobiia bacterium]
MSTEQVDLHRRVQQLEDRTAIIDCIARHARGCDRHDAGLLTSTYHDDGVDEHGATINIGPDYAIWANTVHAATSQAHLHNVTTHTCEIDGDVAHAESYVLVSMLSPDGTTATLLNGRYIDRLERRDGAWRIAVRRSTAEIVLTGDASMLQSPFFKEQSYLKGARDRSDLSYERPLGLDFEGARW